MPLKRKGWLFWTALLFRILLPFTAEAQEQGNLEDSLKERVKTLEERMDKLDQVEVIKNIDEYICPGGEIQESLPPGGRCHDGSIPEERKTFRKLFVSRRESISEKIQAALEEAESKRVAVGGSARGILQQLLNSPGNDKLFGEGSVELFFLSRPMAYSVFFVDLEAIGGAGPDEYVGSLTRLNSDAETLGVGNTDQVKVREAWLQIKLLREQLEIVGGKLDFTNYFDRNAVANDETAEFLNGSLVNNPLLEPPLNGPGFTLRYHPGKDYGIVAGMQSFNKNGSSIGQRVYAIVEFDYHAHFFSTREGNYRFWGNSGIRGESQERKNWASGVSFDQQMSDKNTFFTRAGMGGNDETTDKDYSFSTGVELRLFSESFYRDRIGLAYSYQQVSGNRENVGEGYFNHFLTDRLNVTFDLQWLLPGSNSLPGQKYENIIIPGIRTTINF